MEYKVIYRVIPGNLSVSRTIGDYDCKFINNNHINTIIW